MIPKLRCDLTHDLFLPTLLFMAMGGMTWAVRGCSGYGASAGCIFAGVMWGAGWWYLSHESRGPQTRRYYSAWIILALTLGIGFSGGRGWMQWPWFFSGKLSTNAGKNEFVEISTWYGFLWMFIAGIPWAGLGACLLAWCGSLRETKACHWLLRIGMGVGGYYLANYLFALLPSFFMPLYSTMESQYQDFDANPSLRRLTNDNRAAIDHLGYYIGFLLFEVIRRDWKNVVLILTVGILNGLGWSLLQTWHWAAEIWPDYKFNWWRCWESSGGLSIGFAYGIAYFLVNRKMSDKDMEVAATRPALEGPNFEWFVVYSGLVSYGSMFLSMQTSGWSPYCLAVLQLFGLIYYLRRRAAGADSTMFVAILISLLHLLIVCLPIITRHTSISEIPGFSRRMLFAYAQIGTGVVTLLGVGWHWLKRKQLDEERAVSTPNEGDPTLERLGLYLGLLFGLGHSIRSGLKGWFNIYLGNEDHWSRVLWNIIGPAFIVLTIVIAIYILLRPLPSGYRGVVFPYSYGAIWLVLIVQNTLAFLVTGPPTNWIEMQFNLYYLQMFLITAVIVAHYRTLKKHRCEVLEAASVGDRLLPTNPT